VFLPFLVFASLADPRDVVFTDADTPEDTISKALAAVYEVSTSPFLKL
jgi:hypothetical protein